MIICACHGAAKQVTGSCHLVICNQRRVLIDCGLFQGSRESELRVIQTRPFGVRMRPAPPVRKKTTESAGCLRDW